jgi:hypothetical protein
VSSGNERGAVDPYQRMFGEPGLHGELRLDAKKADVIPDYPY